MKHVKIILSVLLTVTIITISFIGQYQLLIQDIENTAKSKEAQINRYVDLCVGFVDMMTLYSNDYFERGIGNDADLYSMLQYDPETNTYNLDAIQDTKYQNTSGNLTGENGIPTEDIYRSEVNLALYLNKEFNSVYNKIPEAAWIYYTSENNFVNLYPWTVSKDFAFDEALKKEQFYTCVIPENKGMATVKEIYVKFNTDDFTLIEEMKSGTVDYWSGITMDAQAQLKDSENVTIARKTYPVVDFMEINTDNSIFADLKLRQALCLLLDREAICELTNGAAVPAYSMIFDNMMYFSQAAKDDFMNNYANDVERGKALIAEAGWADTDGDGYLDKDGQMAEFIMYASTDPTRQIFVQDMQEQLKQYGFKMNIEAIDWNYVHEYLCANDYDTGIHSLEWAEPILILNCCFDDPNAANNNEAFYAAIDDAATTVDDAERSDKLGAIQIEMLHPEWNMIPVYSDVYYVAHNSAVKGINILQNGFIYWNDLAL